MTCADLIPFCDGDLVGAQREAFQRHLAECPECPRSLLFHMQIDVRLREIGEQMRARRAKAEATAVEPPKPSRWQRFRAWLCKW